PDVGLAGGLTHTRKIAAIAESFHSAIVTHNFLGPVLTAASVHLDTAIPNFVVQEYARTDETNKWSGFQGVLQRQGGYLLPPENPGLGIRLVDTTLDGPLGPLVQTGVELAGVESDMEWFALVGPLERLG